MDRYLTHLWEEFAESLFQTERAMTTMLADLKYALKSWNCKYQGLQWRKVQALQYRGHQLRTTVVKESKIGSSSKLLNL